MKALLIGIAAAVGLVAGSAYAEADLKANGCLGCHDMDKKKVGPSFKDIAAKHKGKGEAALVAKLKDGKGHKKVAASDDDIKSLVDQVLSAK